MGRKNYETTSLKNQSDIHRELILNQLSTVILISSFPAGSTNFPNQETGARGQGARKGMLIIKLKIYDLHSGYRKANLMLNDLKYPPEKRGCCKLAKLQGKNGRKSVKFKIQSF